ncbi:MAG: peptide chain release factor N(5)-glutamine methyltransferase [endosymbiont of Galathealinum brachiosum]|uniref:Release factor glutamine methyltransferase n=1 Tax=endosymbiont of Galathealinum brachiosum TaxID=2200906 RepID=A0A370D9Z9_9GAMM|nr:MAG: peptide chain release factor N(5)-glutamine methyltransferase [endosymbiont of Galathealinum brachiosum]
MAATKQLEKTSDSPRLDAEVLLAHSLNKNRTWLITWSDRELTEPEILNFEKRLTRREKGEPVAHITGSREFWSLDLQVSKDTLIPRPETELIIEKILEQYAQSSDIKVLDLGTGSGAIALALASERPGWEITATDKSAAALEIANRNAQQLNLNNINFIHGNWFEPFENPSSENLLFDIIASNPPYIPDQDPHLSQGDVRFEPMSALASGKDGLNDIRQICQLASKHLKPGAMLIIEHGFDQKEELHNIFMHSGYKNISQYTDLTKNPRLTSGINL